MHLLTTLHSSLFSKKLFYAFMLFFHCNFHNLITDKFLTFEFFMNPNSMLLEYYLRSQSVGALLLYLFPSLSGSPAISGDLARSDISIPPRLTVGLSKVTTVSATLSLAAFLATSSWARLSGSLGMSSPSGVGRGPLGTWTGFLSKWSDSKGNPSPALAQFTSCKQIDN